MGLQENIAAVLGIRKESLETTRFSSEFETDQEALDFLAPGLKISERRIEAVKQDVLETNQLAGPVPLK